MKLILKHVVLQLGGSNLAVSLRCHFFARAIGSVNGCYLVWSITSIIYISLPPVRMGAI